MLPTFSFLTFSAFSGLLGCRDKPQSEEASTANSPSASVVSNAPAAEDNPNRLGDYSQLAGSFPTSMDMVLSGYGIDYVSRILQRAWRMAEQAKAFQHITTPVVQLASKNPKDLGLDERHPIMLGIDLEPSTALMRLSVTNGSSAQTVFKAVMTEMGIPETAYALKVEGSAIWIAIGQTVSSEGLNQLLSGAKLSSDSTFSDLAKHVPKAADYSFQISKAAIDTLLSQGATSEVLEMLRLNLVPDSVFYSYGAQGKSVFKSHHAFEDDAFVSQLKTKSSNSDILSHLPTKSPWVLSSHVDISSVFDAMKSGRLGLSAQALTQDLDGNPNLKGSKDVFIKGYEGPMILTFAPGVDREVPIVPILAFKTNNPTGYSPLITDLCGQTSGKIVKIGESSFCKGDDVAFGVWKSHLVATLPDYLPQFAQPGNASNTEMQNALSQSTLLTGAFDFEAMTDMLPDMPGFSDDMDGFQGILGLAATIEIFQEFFPQVMTQTARLNGNVIDTEMVVDTNISSLSVLFPTVGVIAAVAIPNFISMAAKSKRAEVPTNMKAIKTAQLIYEMQHDAYVACDAYPSIPTKVTQRWEKSQSGGFATLNWSPVGEVRGSYSVTTTPTNFIITGLSDTDGDGVYATYVATKSENPTLITPPDVY